MFDLRIRGIAKLRREVRALASAYPRAAAAALYEEGEAIMRVSKDLFVPVDLGTLKSSGKVDLPLIRPGVGITVRLTYGGAAKAYALVQHESPTFHHPHGSWKYLELPMRAAVGGMGGRIGARIRSRLGVK